MCLMLRRAVDSIRGSGVLVIYFWDLRALLLFGVSLLVMLRVNPPM